MRSYKLFVGLVTCTLLYASPTVSAKEVKKVTNNVKKSEQNPIPGEQYFSSHLSHQVFGVLYAEMLMHQGKTKQAADTIHYLASLYVDAGIYRRALAILSLNNGDERLISVAKNWVNIEPESLEARQKLVGAMIRQQQLNGIVDDLAFVINSQPDKIASNLLSINHLFASIKDKEKVLAVVSELTDKYPNLAEALIAKATAYSNANKITEADELAKRAGDLKPDWETPALFRATIEQNSANKAIDILQDFLNVNPNSKTVKQSLIKLLTAAKRYNEAEQTLLQALSESPGDAETIYSLGLLALEQKNYPKAEEYLQRLLNIDSVDKNKVHYILAKIYEQQKNFPTAIEYFNNVIDGEYYLSARGSAINLLVKDKQFDNALILLKNSKVDSDRAKIFISITEAQIYREANQLKKSLESIKLALRSYPNNPDLLYEGAMYADQLDLHSEAESKLRLAIKHDPDNYNYLNALGYILAERNVRLEEAEQLIKKALTLAPQMPQILDSMGWILYRKGKFTEAMVFLEKAYNLLPDPEVAAHIVEVKWFQGSHLEAEKFLEAASKISPEHDAFKKVRKIIQTQ